MARGFAQFRPFTAMTIYPIEGKIANLGSNFAKY